VLGTRDGHTRMNINGEHSLKATVREFILQGLQCVDASKNMPVHHLICVYACLRDYYLILCVQMSRADGYTFTLLWIHFYSTLIKHTAGEIISEGCTEDARGLMMRSTTSSVHRGMCMHSLYGCAPSKG
jgi:hypothetical protein